MKLPTPLGIQILEHRFKVRMTEYNMGQPRGCVAAFQRMALVADFDVSMACIQPWFDKGEPMKEGDEDYEACKAIYGLVRKDVLGYAIGTVFETMTGHTSDKDKLQAAEVLNGLFGEKEQINDSTITDKLIVNLVGK